jgi:hypothetical protein
MLSLKEMFAKLLNKSQIVPLWIPTFVSMRVLLKRDSE